MIMTKTTKIAASVLVAGAVALSILPSAQASTITGTVSFSGGVTGYTGPSGPGIGSVVNADFTLDHSLVFNADSVVASPLPSGTYAGLAGTGVTIYSPLQINPTGTPPVPSPNPLWKINGTLLTFTVSTLIETVVTPNYMVLFGTGTLGDGVAADSNTGTWVATFTSAVDGGTGIATFGFNSSAAATVPDGGTSLIFLGLGLTALAGFAQFRKQVA
jgi:hypothetical protein